MKKIFRVCIIGMGGFAGDHHCTVKQLEAEGECRLVCTCDPKPEMFQKQMATLEFERRGVRVLNDYVAMLDKFGDELDMVMIPTPLPLHAEMHRACVERGLPVYLEKPPTLNYAELDAMLAVEAQAVKQTMVGFQTIAESTCQTIKRRLLAGEFGALQEVRFLGLWPRTSAYFTRNYWAGRLLLKDQLVLDFCMGNAMAHYLHNLLFWSGNAQLTWAEVESVEAELYRAHRVESPDTVFVRARLTGGVTLKAALSHACAGTARHQESIICNNACINRLINGEYRIEWRNGRVETIAPDTRSTRIEATRHYYAYLRGDTERPLTRLSDTRPFVRLCSLSYVAAGRIVAVPAAFVQRSPAPEGQGEWMAISNLEKVAETFLTEGLWPERQTVPWAAAGGHAAPADLYKLNAVVKKMAAESHAERSMPANRNAP